MCKRNIFDTLKILINERNMVSWKITLAKAETLLPLLLALAFLASWARVAAIKLSWASSCTRKNHGVLLSVLSLEKKSFPESSASSWTNTKCSDGEPMPRREAVSSHGAERTVASYNICNNISGLLDWKKLLNGYTTPAWNQLSMLLKIDHSELKWTGISSHLGI